MDVSASDTPGGKSPSPDDLLNQGISLVQIEIPDINGTLRGKLTGLEKIAGTGGSAFCTILYGFTLFDEICETQFSSFANGFPDVPPYRPDDPASPRPGQWVATVICDIQDPATGASYPLSPRGALRRAIERADAMGYAARFAVELEFCVLEVDDPAVLGGGHYDLEPSGRIHNAYSLTRIGELREIAAGFIAEMRAIGIGIEAFHAELGRGMFELAIAHLPALEAADAAARVKLYLKDYLARHGLTPVFMPKWRIENPAAAATYIKACGPMAHLPSPTQAAACRTPRVPMSPASLRP